MRKRDKYFKRTAKRLVSQILVRDDDILLRKLRLNIKKTRLQLVFSKSFSLLDWPCDTVRYTIQTTVGIIGFSAKEAKDDIALGNLFINLGESLKAPKRPLVFNDHPGRGMYACDKHGGHGFMSDCVICKEEKDEI